MLLLFLFNVFYCIYLVARSYSDRVNVSCLRDFELYTSVCIISAVLVQTQDGFNVLAHRSTMLQSDRCLKECATYCSSISSLFNNYINNDWIFIYVWTWKGPVSVVVIFQDPEFHMLTISKDSYSCITFE